MGSAVVVGALGLACAVHSPCATKGLHLESGVVGKAVKAVMGEHVLGLLPGIFLQSIARFGDVDVATNVFERHYLELRAQDLPYLIELMRVVGGEDRKSVV